ncbi:MAG TPA: N-acyl homoserine lactonase family protein [Gemmatimonadales bacterium]
MRTLLPVCILATSIAVRGAAQSPEYEILALRYATVPGFPASGLVIGADPDERIDIAMVFWLIRGDGHVILFDSGFHRAGWFERFDVRDYLRPDSVLRLAGVAPESVTDIIVSHAHWDHMGGIDLFPNAVIWIQRDEFAWYTGEAWQNGGRGGGADPEDLVELVQRNTQGTVRLVGGDDVEILPGIRVYTGARHTYASQYIRVADAVPVILASDNAYLYRNLAQHRPVATFTRADTTANVQAQARMLRLGGGIDQVVPGHDPQLFTRYPTEGRVARIR